MSKEATVEKTYVNREPIYDFNVHVHACELVSQPRPRTLFRQRTNWKRFVQI